MSSSGSGTGARARALSRGRDGQADEPEDVEERLESGLDKPRTVNPYKTAQQLREEGVIPDYADVPRMDGYDSVGQSRSGTLARGSADVVPANVPAAICKFPTLYHQC